VLAGREVLATAILDPLLNQSQTLGAA